MDMNFCNEKKNESRDGRGIGVEGLALEAALMNRQVLELLSYGLVLETAATERYKDIAAAMVSEDDIRMIRDILLDVVKHKRLLEELCVGLAGSKPDVSGFSASLNQKELWETLPGILHNRAIEELRSAQFYRQLLSTMSCVEHRDAIFEILVNKQNHAQQMTLLFAKYTR